MALPRISILLELVSCQIELQARHGQPLPPAEMIEVAKLLRHFSTTAGQMEVRLDGLADMPLPAGENVVSFMAALAARGAGQNAGDRT